MLTFSYPLEPEIIIEAGWSNLAADEINSPVKYRIVVR